MTSLDELYDTFFRPLNVRWRLNNASRRRVLLAASIPAVLIIAQVIQAILLYSFDEYRVYGDGFTHRVYTATAVLLTMSPVAVAVLFFAGLRPWSRAEGSWMLLAGAILAVVAIVFGLMAAVVLTVITDRELISDLRAEVVWLEIVRTFGLLSIGFFFVAYRGLSESRT